MPPQALVLAAVAAAASVAIGLGVLCGWAFDISILRSGLPGLTATHPWSAVLLIVCGLAVMSAAHGSQPGHYLAQGCAFVALFVAGQALAQSAIGGVELGIERWLFAEALAREQPQDAGVNRISEIAALIFVLSALALLLSGARSRALQNVFVSAATIGLLLAASVSAGFLFDLRAIHGSTLYEHLSLPRSLGQTAAAFGILCLRPDLGWMQLLAGSSPAARELRSLAIGVITLPLALAIILQLGFRGGLYESEVRTALMVLVSIIVVFIALLMTAARLKRIDDNRQRTAEAQQRVESELSIALAAAKMVVLHYDLEAQSVRRLAAGSGSVRLSEVRSYEDHLRLVHAEDRQRVAGYLLQRQHAGEREYQLQYRLGHGQQDTKWVLERGEIRYEGNRPAEISSVLIDITQTVQAREALEESEERFQRLAESMPQIVYVTAPGGEIEYVNRRWFEYTGATSANRDDYAALMPAEDFDAIGEAWQRGLEQAVPFAAEFRLRGTDGLYRWFLTRAVPVMQADGRIVRWCGTSTDIDAQKRASEELRLVTDQADVMLVHCDAEARYVFVNKVYARRLERAPETIIGKTIREVVGAPTYERIEPYVQRALAGESVTFEVEVSYETLGARFMNCQYVPDIDDSGRVRGFVAAITDMTERRQLEEQLREADHRKDEFIALLAHELRNPLAPIRYAAGLLKPGVPPEISAAAHDVIERQVGHMGRLLDDLLDVSRITRNMLELRLERIDLREIVTSAVDTVRPLFEAVNHKLTVSLPPEAASVSGDSARLLQIIGNLLNNAGKYTEPGGHIEVEIVAEEATFAIRVRDSGIGIDPELLPKLFDLFVQGDRTLTRASGGLGVGLSLAKRLVEMHGGTIEAHSDGVGRGSEFTVRLPSAAEACAGEPRAVNEAVLPIFQRKHQLLIVDDNLDAANSLAILAQLSGYVTHIANDGLAAIEMAEIVRPEAIIMDLGMPRMSGFEAARWVRQQPWGKDTVLIAVTGWGQDEDRRKSREAGFDVHLTKPVDSTELLNHLQRADEERAPGRASS